MKILLVSNMYPSNSKPYAGIFVKNQYEELKDSLEAEDSIEIFYMKRQFTSPLGTVFKYLRAFISFTRYLFRRYDLVHLHFFYPLIYLVWIYKKIHPKTKIIVTFHGSDITSSVHDKNKKHLRKIAKAVDFTIPVGSTIARIVEEKLRLKTGRILPVGVNNNVFYFEENQPKIYDFISIGSFIHLKGIDIVIKAIKELTNDDISFCFCGSGDYLQELQQLQKDHKITIKQNQTQEQLKVLLNKSKYFLLMSRNEGFPTATIEAFYCGIPVITSDIPQFKEQVKEGINGFMVPMDDVNWLKSKLEEAIQIEELDYMKLQQGALNSFKELSLNNICHELIEIYKNLIEN